MVFLVTCIFSLYQSAIFRASFYIRSQTMILLKRIDNQEFGEMREEFGKYSSENSVKMRTKLSKNKETTEKHFTGKEKKINCILKNKKSQKLKS